MRLFEIKIFDFEMCTNKQILGLYSPVKCARKWTKLNGPRKCHLYFMVCELITKNFMFTKKKNLWLLILRTGSDSFVAAALPRYSVFCHPGPSNALTHAPILCRQLEETEDRRLQDSVVNLQAINQDTKKRKKKCCGS